MTQEENKYEILKESPVEFSGRTLYRIRAARDFGEVKKGDIGGLVEDDNNLSQIGDCWLFDDAKAFNGAYIGGGLKMRGSSEINGAILYTDGDIKDTVRIRLQHSFFAVFLNGGAVGVPLCEQWRWYHAPEYYGILFWSLLQQLRNLLGRRRQSAEVEATEIAPDLFHGLN